MDAVPEVALLLQRGRGRRRRRLFRTAQLNARGWIALVAATIGCTLVLVILGVSLGWPAWPLWLLGPAAVFGTLLTLDRARARRLRVSFSWTDDVEVVRRVADELAARGVPASVVEEVDERPALLVRQKDLRLLRQLLVP